jgi:uncharacterized cupredoxin-like copper-binding protein
MNARRFLGGLSLMAVLALTACGGGGGTAASPSPAAGGNGGEAQTVEVSADPSGQLAFVEKTLQGAAGQEFPVHFRNPAPVEHNWVLVEPGQEDAVANASLGQAGNAVGLDGVIVATEVHQQNEDETVTVPALEAGEYTYICTVPGHYQAGMRGTLTIR